jgi:hypothetical protein
MLNARAIAGGVACLVALTTAFLVLRPTTFKLHEAGDSSYPTRGQTFIGSINFRNGLAEIVVNGETYKGVVFLVETPAPNWKGARVHMFSAGEAKLDCHFSVRDDYYGMGECISGEKTKYIVEIGERLRM